MLRNRLERDRARHDTRQWVQDRRARTRHLIELGGLVQKAGLVELLDDDRATLLGALLGLADQLRHGSDDATSPANLRTRWRRRGLRTFDADKDAAAAASLGRRKEDGQPGTEAPAGVMEIDEDRIDDAVLALLWLTLHDGGRAWKGHDWDALGRLHAKGMILDPVGKAKSVVMTEEGLRRRERLFEALFSRRPTGDPRDDPTARR